jgi:hypothetical protein
MVKENSGLVLTKLCVERTVLLAAQHDWPHMLGLKMQDVTFEWNRNHCFLRITPKKKGIVK